MSSRSSRSPECRRTTRMVGAKRLNSLTQLESTESGATMSEGPSRPHSKRRYARKAITCPGSGLGLALGLALGLGLGLGL